MKLFHVEKVQETKLFHLSMEISLNNYEIIVCIYSYTYNYKVAMVAVFKTNIQNDLVSIHGG